MSSGLRCEVSNNGDDVIYYEVIPRLRLLAWRCEGNEIRCLRLLGVHLDAETDRPIITVGIKRR